MFALLDSMDAMVSRIAQAPRYGWTWGPGGFPIGISMGKSRENHGDMGIMKGTSLVKMNADIMENERENHW
jgi:hypothetical protein